MSRETFRRSLKEKGSLSLKTHSPKKREGEIMLAAKSKVATMAPTTPIYDGIQIMSKEGFRRIPITDPGTKTLAGIVTATDIVSYLGGGEKFQIIQQKFGGNIFKAINEPIKLIMTQKAVYILNIAKISDAIKLMKEKKVGGLPIVDSKNRVTGIITERDIMNLFADKMSSIKVEDLMSEAVVTALPTTTIFEATRTMTTQGFRRLPIIFEGKAVGMITAMDIIRFFGSGQVFAHLKSGTIIQVLNTPAIEIASKNVITVDPTEDAGQAAKIMREKNIGALLAVKNGKFVGMLTERDFFKIIE